MWIVNWVSHVQCHTFDRQCRLLQTELILIQFVHSVNQVRRVRRLNTDTVIRTGSLTSAVTYVSYAVIQWRYAAVQSVEAMLYQTLRSRVRFPIGASEFFF